MGKRKQSGIDMVASMPWPAGILLGLIGYIAIRYGIGWYFGATGNLYLSGLGKLATTGIYAPLGWMLMVVCWIGAIASFIGRTRRRKLLDSQTDINSLSQMSWQQFEQLTGEAFRRQGYAVGETGLGGADGGIDLILRKNGQTTLVQCKQWRSRQIGVSVVREMYGVLMHEGAHAVKIVALGSYTSDASRFTEGKPIELIHGEELIATVRSLQTRKTHATGPMDSPLALIGSMVAILLMIAVRSSVTAIGPTPLIRPSAAIQPAAYAIPTPVPRPTPTSPPHAQAMIYVSDSQNAAQLHEWKKRNAESMKILEQTTKEMPLR